MNMNELGMGDDQLVFYWSGGVDPLQEYGGGMTESELALMRELDPNFDYVGDDGVIDLANNYTYKATAADALWLPDEEKSGLKDKVQALIRRCHDEVGRSFAALGQYVTEHASEFDDFKDEVKGRERPPTDLGDSIDADPSLAPGSSSSTTF